LCVAWPSRVLARAWWGTPGNHGAARCLFAGSVAPARATCNAARARPDLCARTASTRVTSAELARGGREHEERASAPRQADAAESARLPGRGKGPRNVDNGRAHDENDPSLVRRRAAAPPRPLRLPPLKVQPSSFSVAGAQEKEITLSAIKALRTLEIIRCAPSLIRARVDGDVRTGFRTPLPAL